MSHSSSYFKKVQARLLHFFHLNSPLPYKDKDLLGPLKYLNPLNLDPPLDLDPLVDEDKALEISRLQNSKEDFSHSPTLWGLSLDIKRKPYLRSLRFCVLPNGNLQVTAPLKTDLINIKKELSEHKNWILKCSQEQEFLRLQFPVKKFVNGASFEYLGELFLLKIEAASLKRPMIQFDMDFISLFYPQDWDFKPNKEKEDLLKKTLRQFYKEQALTFLNQRLRKLSQSTGLFPKKVSYRSQKTRWGSCSTTSSIVLNWKLIVFKPEVIDYVTIHELCHLKHANHSFRFWDLVESHCPEHKRLKKILSHNQFCADFLSPESELYPSNPSL